MISNTLLLILVIIIFRVIYLDAKKNKANKPTTPPPVSTPWYDQPEKVVDMSSRPSKDEPVYDVDTERKMRRLRKKIDRLQEKIDEEEAREREYNRMAAELEDIEKKIAILQRIIDAETPEKEEVDSGPDITGGISMN